MTRRPLVLLAAVGILAGCGGTPSADPPATSPAPPSASTSPTPTAHARPSRASGPSAKPRPKARPGTIPPRWLGTRALPVQSTGYGKVEPTPPELRTRRFTLPDQIPELPGKGFASRVEQAPAAVIARSTWSPSCPVSAAQLSWVRLTFWGFDNKRHTGELLVNAGVADDVVTVFRKLYAARFPLEQMHITTKAERDAKPTGDGNNTGAFNCRPAIGSAAYSQHAYGLAIDVDPFQNPYVKGDLVLPELASAYVDRNRRAPGIIRPGDVVTRAFASIGWGWGGDWHSLKDYEHFSQNGR